MKKISIILVFILVLSGFSATTTLGTNNFSDLSDSNRFYDEIQYLAEDGIITGFPDNSFRPKGNVTRGQAAIMLGRALGYDGTPRDSDFPDVDSSQVSSGYIEEAAENGIINGYPDGTYRPGATVTRAEMSIILQRAFYPEAKENHFVLFPDVSENMQSYEAIGIIGSYGVVQGYTDGTFRPYVNLNREQFSAFLARAINPAEFVTGVDYERLQVSFLDVGQGDAIYIEYPNGENVLVDAARYASTIETALEVIGVEQIDTFIATHPDADHIGGAAHVIGNYGVTHVIDSGQTHTTQTYIDYLETIDASGATFEVTEIGDELSEDPEVSVEVLFVDSDAADLNDGSIVLKVTHGVNEYLLTGDAGYEVEEQLMAEGADINADVLKVSHHGSDTATSAEFLAEVDPIFSILSVGNNAYGHPDSDVLERILTSGSAYISTEEGSIHFFDDGEQYEIYQNDQVAEPAPEPTPDPNPVDPGDGQISDALTITGKNLQTEVVTVKNNGTTNVDMTNWTLLSTVGNQTYTFPDGFVLQAGASVNITAGANAVHNPPSSLEWSGAYIWNNDGDAAELYGPNGSLVHRLP
ncbi:S-layer homology domain-containing protein [Planococcus salinus]|uniref:MBL fold metallo-hydrolase n=1 Tax=Planococcus salinus TaxID=1848460 RepID=A0A3M8P7U7_9BACL|nr:S-layer homology domain-containing protein [Planococcus salinus]RNF39756.1 MBL fold metallo-hydrolase [Planococcus salinus]